MALPPVRVAMSSEHGLSGRVAKARGLDCGALAVATGSLLAPPQCRQGFAINVLSIE